MPTEKEWNIIQHLLSESTSKEIKKLKKNLAKEITNKLGIKIFKEQVINYLVNDGTFKDIIGDKVKESILWEKWLNLITPQLKELRDKINNANTEEALEKLRIDIFEEMWEKKQDSKESSKSDNSNTNNTTTQTSTTESTTNWQTNTNSSNTGQQSAPSSTESTSTEKAKVDSSESYEIDHLNFKVSSESKNIWENLKWKEKPDLEPFACALKAYNSVKRQGKINNPKYLTVIDFTKKKWKKRFFVINMENNTVEHAVKVWHWKNTWKDRATNFSNKSWSKQSSLWWYLLPDVITKSPNKSWSWLRQITWLESSNNNAAQRWIAVHPWWENGSEWCFTLPKDISKTIMEKIKWSFLFAYAESKQYFAQSDYFQKNSDGSIAA